MSFLILLLQLPNVAHLNHSEKFALCQASRVLAGKLLLVWQPEQRPDLVVQTLDAKITNRHCRKIKVPGCYLEGATLKLAYIDESGTGLKDRQSRHFLLAAFTIDSSAWVQLDGAMSALKRSMIAWAKPEDWEIKGRDIGRGDGVFQSMNWEGRLAVFEHIASFIAAFNCRMYVVQVDKQRLPRTIESDSDLYRIVFWRLLDLLDGQLFGREE